MKKIILAVLITVFAASAVQAAWFSDDFESYAAGTRLRLTAGWQGPPVGVGPENYVQAWGGGQAVRLRGMSGSAANSEAYSTGDLSASSAGNLQVLSFTLQSDLANQLPGYNHLYVKLQGVGGADMGFWYGSSGAVAPRFLSTPGPGISITDGAVHTFGIRYDPATGLTEWVHNGSVHWSQTRPTGMAVKQIYVQDQHRTDDFGAPVNDWVYLDNVMVVPEPGALALLLLGGLTCVRRRRA